MKWRPKGSEPLAVGCSSVLGHCVRTKAALLPTISLDVLFAVVTDLVPVCLRAYPNVVYDRKVFGTVQQAYWHEHAGWVVVPGHARAAFLAEPRFPV